MLNNRYLLIYLIFISCALLSLSAIISAEEKLDNENCIAIDDKNTLNNGWYLWDPYQYNKISPGGYELTGMDIELVKKISEKINIKVEYAQIDWERHQLELAEGTSDMAAGATYTRERAEYAYFSEAYRYEENSVFMLKNSDKDLSFKSVAEFLTQIRLQNFKLGVTQGFIYADPQINLFISDRNNRDIIRKYKNDVESLGALMRGEIDGFIADRIVGAASILHANSTAKVKELQLNVKTPIHLMFSKKSVSAKLVDKYNQAIREFKDDEEYRSIVKTYLYPVMLLQTIDSEWFYLIGIIGTIAFAVSGIAIAARDNSTLFGTFLFAMLPSVGGGIMRDILINREDVGLFLTPSYMYYIIAIVLIGFSLIRLLERYNEKSYEDDFMTKFWDTILVLGDALGQAAFIVTGVAIAIMARIEPIELWGPFFAFLTANGGGILRDLLRKQHYVICLNGAINAEVSILWGLIFSVFLNISSYSPDYEMIKNAVIIVAAGALITRMAAYYLKIPNLRFREEKDEFILKEALDIQDEVANHRKFRYERRKPITDPNIKEPPKL